MAEWLRWHVYGRETVLYPASGVAITRHTLLGRWTWKTVHRLEPGAW